MKKIWTKIPAMIGILFTLATVLFLIKALIYILFPDLFNDGTSFYEPIYEAWMCELSALMYSAFGIMFFVVDAIISTIKAVMNIDRRFNIVLSSMIAGGFAFAVVVLCTPLRIYKSVIWFLYYLLLFALEIASVIKHIKVKRAEKQELSI